LIECVRPFYREPSAAQNGTVIQTCKQCGAINQGSTELCCFCEARLNSDEQTGVVSPAPVAVASPLKNSTCASAPPWRHEVSKRLRSYHARQLGVPEEAEEPQADLPFEAQQEAEAPAMTDEMEDPMQATLASASAHFENLAPPVLAAEPPTHSFEHMLIDVSRPPETDSASREGRRAGTRSSESQQPKFSGKASSAVPVAELSLRWRSALVDAACIALAFTGILGLFVAFGGRIVPGKSDALICGATLGLLYVQYFMLFSMMGGATPGMMFAGLRVVSYEGTTPSPGRLMWRSFGYAVSGGTAMLGYFWALWDQDHLTWHDRISQTYVTRAEFLFETRPTQDTRGLLPHPHI
jgi:uncharacterized RDD family membrane protein YckC